MHDVCIIYALLMLYLLFTCFTYALLMLYFFPALLMHYLCVTYALLLLYFCAQVRAAIEAQADCTCALLMHYLCFTDALRYGELTKLGRLPSKLIAKPLNGAALRSRTTHLTCGERYFTAA